MPVYVALLRGINIGPHKRMKMDGLARKLGECIVRDFGFAADVIVRTGEELQSVIAQNPLLKIRGVDPAKLHVVFLAEKPSAAALKKLHEITLSPDQVRDAGKEIYFYFPNGVSGSSLWKHSLDKVLSVTGTMRNWNTVNQLHCMAKDLR